MAPPNIVRAMKNKAHSAFGAKGSATEDGSINTEPDSAILSEASSIPSRYSLSISQPHKMTPHGAAIKTIKPKA